MIDVHAEHETLIPDHLHQMHLRILDRILEDASGLPVSSRIYRSGTGEPLPAF